MKITAFVIACGLLPPTSAVAQQVKIVGIGAATCEVYLNQIASAPTSERDYLAWAQGYMSGILVRAPAGKDEDLDLAPQAFPLGRQASFLREWCLNHANADFADGVQELYRALRAPPG